PVPQHLETAVDRAARPWRRDHPTSSGCHLLLLGPSVTGNTLPPLVARSRPRQARHVKAFVLEKYSGPMRETEMPVPAPGPDEVLVRVSAAGVNHADERVRSGEFRQIFPVELPMVMGSELSGVVVDRGAGVDDLAPGTP